MKKPGVAGVELTALESLNSDGDSDSDSDSDSDLHTLLESGRKEGSVNDNSQKTQPYTDQRTSEISGRSKLVAFLSLVVVQSTHTLLFRVSQVKGTYTYNTASAIAITELIKCCLSVLFHVRSKGDEPLLPNIKIGEFLRYTFLAACYCANNQMTFYILKLMDPGRLSLGKSLSPSLTAVCLFVIFNRKVNVVQWSCIAIISCGLVAVLSKASCDNGTANEEHTPSIAALQISALLVSCFITATSSVINANMIQKLSTPLHVQNAMLYSQGFVLNMIAYAVGLSASRGAAFFDGYDNWIVLMVLLFQSLMGLVITCVYKYGGAVVKTLATCANAALLTVVDIVLFGAKLVPAQAGGAAVVVVASYLYFKVALNMPQPQQIIQPTVQSASKERWVRCGIGSILSSLAAISFMVLVTTSSAVQQSLSPSPSPTQEHEQKSNPPPSIYQTDTINWGLDVALNQLYGPPNSTAVKSEEHTASKVLAVCIVGQARGLYMHEITEQIKQAVLNQLYKNNQSVFDLFISVETADDTPAWAWQKTTTNDLHAYTKSDFANIYNALQPLEMQQYQYQEYAPESLYYHGPAYSITTSCGGVAKIFRDRNRKYWGLPAVYPISRSRATCAAMIKRQEKKMSKEYDYIMLLRPDVVYSHRIPRFDTWPTLLDTKIYALGSDRFFVGRRFAMMQLINMWPTMYSGFYQDICPDSDKKFMRQHPKLISKMVFPSNTNAEYWNSYFYSVVGLSFCTANNNLFNLAPWRQSYKLPNRTWSVPPPLFDVSQHGRNGFLC